MSEIAGLRSFTSVLEYDFSSTQSSFAVENVLAGNGLTIISPVGKNVLIKRICVYASLSPRNPNTGSNAGYQINDFQVEFNLVDFAGQFIQDGYSFNNLFVPDPSISVVSDNAFEYAINDIVPDKEFCVMGGGFYIRNIKFGFQAGLGVLTNYTARFVFTLDYKVV